MNNPVNKKLNKPFTCKSHSTTNINRYVVLFFLLRSLQIDFKLRMISSWNFQLTKCTIGYGVNELLKKQITLIKIKCRCFENSIVIVMEKLGKKKKNACTFCFIIIVNWSINSDLHKINTVCQMLWFISLKLTE